VLRCTRAQIEANDHAAKTSTRTLRRATKPRVRTLTLRATTTLGSIEIPFMLMFFATLPNWRAKPSELPVCEPNKIVILTCSGAVEKKRADTAGAERLCDATRDTRLEGREGSTAVRSAKLLLDASREDTAAIRDALSDAEPNRSGCIFGATRAHWRNISVHTMQQERND
jgi:hypothetical protein